MRTKIVIRTFSISRKEADMNRIILENFARSAKILYKNFVMAEFSRYNHLILRKFIFSKFFLVCALLLSLSLISVEGTVSTKILNPIAADLCGNYSQAMIVSAVGVMNSENATLSNVVATLNLSNSSGLRFVTSKDVSLGSIAPLSNSSTNPQWTLECTGTSSGNRIASITYTNSGENVGAVTGEPTTTITLHPQTQADTTPPLITKHSPLTTVTESSTKVTVTTNEAGECKYSTTANTAFDTMTSLFTKVDATNFEVLISSLAEGKKSFFVRCKDALGNINSEDYKIEFMVDFKPTAKITLSDPSPIKPGVVAVTLTTSEDVKLSPSLQYVLGSSAAVSIPLTGKGSLWKGYMVLSADSNNQVGTFLFKGKDVNDNEGTEITENNIFLIELAGLDPPLLVDASSNDDKSINLKWFYTNPSAVSFNIYRSLKKDVSYLDYYQNVPNTLSNIKTFTDHAVNKGITYHYAISVIDGTGDEGLLSPEAWTMSGSNSLGQQGEGGELVAAGGTQIAAENSDQLNTSSLTDSISSLLDKIDQKKNSFKEQKAELVGKTGVQELLSDQKTELLKLRNNVSELFGKAVSPQTTADFQSVQKKIDFISNHIPEDIVEEDSVKPLQKTAIVSTDVSSAITALEKEKKKTLTPQQKENLQKELLTIQQNFVIKSTEEHYVISYKDNQKEFITFITEKITPLKPVLTSSTVVSLFPTGINTSRDVLLIGKNLKRLAEGNGFLSEINTFKDVELIYAIKSAGKPDSPRDGKVVVVPFSFSQAVDSKSSNSITGFAISSLNPVSWSMNTLMIVISVILITGLGGYYFTLSRKTSSPRKSSSPSSHHASHPSLSSHNALLNSRFSFMKKRNHHLPEQVTLHQEPEDSPQHNLQSKHLNGHHNSVASSRSVIPRYSSYSAKEYQKAGLSSLAETSNQHLLLQLQEFIHQLDYDSAIKYHHQLALVPQGTPKDREEKVQLEKLEKKLNLLAWIQQLPLHLERHDYHQMRSVLNKVSAIYNEVLAGKLPAAEAEFALRVREVYDQYAQEVILKYG